MKQAGIGTKSLLFFFSILVSVGMVLQLCCIIDMFNRGLVHRAPFEESGMYHSLLIGYIAAAANFYQIQSEDQSALAFVERQNRQGYAEEIARVMNDSNTNFRYRILSEDGKRELFTNLKEGESFDSLSIWPNYATVEGGQLNVYLSNSVQYHLKKNEENLFAVLPSDVEVLDSLMDTALLDYEMFQVIFRYAGWSEDGAEASQTQAKYVISYGLLPGYPGSDLFSDVEAVYYMETGRIGIYAAGSLFCMVLFFISFIALCRMAGHRAGTEEIVLRFWDKIPFELILTALLGNLILLSVILIFLLSEVVGIGDETARIYLFGGYVVLLMVPAELCIITACVRIKSRNFWRYTLIGRFWGLCMGIFNHLDLSWKFVMLYIVYEFISLTLCSGADAGGVFFLLAILNFFLLLLACRWAVQFSAVRTGAKELSQGNLAYRIDTARLPLLLREHAKHLNHISDGMAAALEEQMKSERLKSELITNVSHDIKTPLTSIINYVDLIKTEEIDNEKVREYIHVLDRQSARLKKLTNDLVEASKASSGAIRVEWQDVDACEMLRQVAGEYSGRLERNRLTPVFSLPDAPVYIRADGALLWRVADNLLSNICKYAMPGTRVYIGVEVDGTLLTISAKNVSRAPLNIPADELMERFVRGDAARTSEGSGLGLSIAQSLTELMGGAFRLEIDGDLFKAMMVYPMMKKREEGAEKGSE